MSKVRNISGKCHRHFKLWLNKQRNTKVNVYSIRYLVLYILSDNLVNTTIIEFLDQKGIILTVNIDTLFDGSYVFESYVNCEWVGTHDSREAATVTAIQHASDLYNSLHK